MNQPMPTSEVLNRAADLIEERGWTQGDGWVLRESTPDAPLCLEGGIQAATGLVGQDRLDALWACPAWTAVADYLDTLNVYGWNDRAGRTASEVVEVLRACAAIEASREREPAEVSA